MNKYHTSPLRRALENRETYTPAESRISFAFAFLIVLALCGLGQWALAGEVRVVNIAGTPELYQDHDNYAFHLHTSAQSPFPNWAPLAIGVVRAVRAGDVWNVAVISNVRRHEAGTLSYSLRVRACNSRGCWTVLPSAVQHITRGARYVLTTRAMNWEAPASARGLLHVRLEARLLSWPPRLTPGAKVFFYPPEQSISISVHKAPPIWSPANAAL